MSSGNYLIDGDDGSHPMSSSYDKEPTQEQIDEAFKEAQLEFWTGNSWICSKRKGTFNVDHLEDVLMNKENGTKDVTNQILERVL